MRLLVAGLTLIFIGLIGIPVLFLLFIIIGSILFPNH